MTNADWLDGDQGTLAAELDRQVTTRVTAQAAHHDTAEAEVRATGEFGARQRTEPDRTPGASHPDSFLAARGWHVGRHGIYVRHHNAPRPDPKTPAGEP